MNSGSAPRTTSSGSTEWLWRLFQSLTRHPCIGPQVSWLSEGGRDRQDFQCFLTLLVRSTLPKWSPRLYSTLLANLIALSTLGDVRFDTVLNLPPSCEVTCNRFHVNNVYSVAHSGRGRVCRTERDRNGILFTLRHLAASVREYKRLSAEAVFSSNPEPSGPSLLPHLMIQSHWRVMYVVENTTDSCAAFLRCSTLGWSLWSNRIAILLVHLLKLSTVTLYTSLCRHPQSGDKTVSCMGQEQAAGAMYTGRQSCLPC